MYNCLRPRRIIVEPEGSKIRKDGSPGRRVWFIGDPDNTDIVSSGRPDQKTGLVPDDYVIPCGHCINCRRNQKLLWTRRIMMESACYKPDDQMFLTLTYDDSKVPFYHNYADFQSFMRSLRKSLRSDGLPGVRFFACAEYGDRTGRPHFHAILFGYNPWENGSIYPIGTAPSGSTLWSDQRIDSAWHNGFAEFSPVSPECIAYVAGYVGKKLDGVDQSFCRMSLKPGIGYQFLKDHLDTIQRDEGFYLRGKFVPLDRYALKVLVRDFGMTEGQKSLYLARRASTAQSFINQYDSTLPRRDLDQRLADAYLRYKQCGTL